MQTLKYVRFTKIWHTLEDEHFLRRQQTFERWTPRTHESPRELARQSEVKRKQAPQIEANVCRHKCNLKKPSFINYTGHPIMHIQQKLVVSFSCLERNKVFKIEFYHKKPEV